MEQLELRQTMAVKALQSSPEIEFRLNAWLLLQPNTKNDCFQHAFYIYLVENVQISRPGDFKSCSK